MDTIELIGKKRKSLFPQTYQMTGVYKGNERFLVGIDPGVNFGITIANEELVTLIWGRLPKEKEPGLYGVHAYDYTEEILYPFYKEGLGEVAVVEGAAYNKYHGQVNLEEVRFGFYLSLRHMGFNVKIMPPAHVRKLATGSGRSEAWIEYPTLNHNAADSIYCAIAARSL